MLTRQVESKASLGRGSRFGFVLVPMMLKAEQVRRYCRSTPLEV
jgi:hypothetical protein